MPFQIVRNDITTMPVDAIVNAANPTLLGGGGVDGAIHRTAGPQLLEECRSLGGCKTGQAKLTKGYKLPAKYVIHTVGPVWHGGNSGEEQLLASCYRESLRIAAEQGFETVAFPLISSGVYGYPKDQALAVAVKTITDFLLEQDMLVYLVVFDKSAFQLSGKLFADVNAFIDDHYVAQKHKQDSRSRRLLEPYICFSETLCADVPKEKRSVGAAPSAMPMAASKCVMPKDMFRELDKGFTETLLQLIDKSGKKDSEIYKKANLSKQHFSKIRNNPDYKPTKPTAIALAIALELDLEQTKDLIGRAGFALTNSSKFDLIIKFCIQQKNYNIVEINLVLFEHDQSLLGA